MEMSVAGSNSAFKCKAVVLSFNAHYHAYEVQHETESIVNVDQRFTLRVTCANGGNSKCD